jgi:hypothetical protein
LLSRILRGATVFVVMFSAAVVASASSGPQLTFRGCGQSLNGSAWVATNDSIANSSCTILQNNTRGWSQPAAESSTHGVPTFRKGLAFAGHSITNSQGRGAWMPGNGEERQPVTCTSTCLGSGAQRRSPFAGTPYTIRPQQWGGSVCTAVPASTFIGSAADCRSTAFYRFATPTQLGGASHTPALQKNVLEQTGSSAAMAIRSRARATALCDPAPLVYVICTSERAAGSSANRVDRVRITNRLVTVSITNQVDQRLNLSTKRFGTWARDPRAEFRIGARLANGELNNSHSVAPFAGGIAGSAYWGAVLPAASGSSATFEYTYADTPIAGRTNTQFTGNRVVLTVNLDRYGDNDPGSPSTCQVFTPARQSQARCSGTAGDGSVQVQRNGTDRGIVIVVGPN